MLMIGYVATDFHLNRSIMSEHVLGAYYLWMIGPLRRTLGKSGVFSMAQSISVLGVHLGCLFLPVIAVGTRDCV